MPIPVNPQSLGDIYSMNPGAFAQAQRQIGLGMQQENLGLQQGQASLQDMYLENQFKRQMNPLKLRQAELNANTTQAQLPGIEADNWKKRRDNEARIPAEQERKAKLSKMAAEMSDEDWKQTENAIKQLMVSPGVKERKMGEFLGSLMPEIQAHRFKEKERMLRETELAKLRAEEIRATNAAKPQSAAAAKPMSMVQYEAMLRIKAMENDPVALQALAQLEEDKRAKAAAGVNVGDEFRRDIMGTPKEGTDKNSTGKVEQKAATKFSAEDQQALEWANANPKDPRAKKIKDKLGVK